MKILHYIPSIDRSGGGTSSYMQLLAKELGKITELHIATHASEHPVLLENAEVHYIGTLLGGKMKGDWLRLLGHIRPDIVHINCCWMPQCAYAQKLAQQTGYKVVLTPHGMLEPWIIKRHYFTRKLPALILYQKRAVAMADCLHATAESEKNNILKLGYNPHIEIIANGIDIRNINIKSSWERKKRLLFISRIHVKKGIECLIDSVAAMRNMLQGYEIVIAGEGDKHYIRMLKKKTVDLGVERMIDFVGWVYDNNKWDLIKNSDALILPTFSENFGIVVAEALACGTPVITTKGAPWHDLETWKCGWWIDRDVDSLTNALREFLMLDEKELEEMGRNGRRLVEEKYSSKVMADKMAELYESLMPPVV